jgi:hypothetical protein
MYIHYTIIDTIIHHILTNYTIHLYDAYYLGWLALYSIAYICITIIDTNIQTNYTIHLYDAYYLGWLALSSSNTLLSWKFDVIALLLVLVLLVLLYAYAYLVSYTQRQKVDTPFDLSLSTAVSLRGVCDTIHDTHDIR